MKTTFLKWPAVFMLALVMAITLQAADTKEKVKPTEGKRVERVLTKAANEAKAIHRAEKSATGYVKTVPAETNIPATDSTAQKQTAAPAAKTHPKDLATLSTKEKKALDYCIYCGQPISGENQTCTASEHKTVCTTSCPDCGRDLRQPGAVGKDGVHRCTGKLQIKVAPKQIPGKKTVK